MNGFAHYWVLVNSHVSELKDLVQISYPWFVSVVFTAFTVVNSLRILAYVPQMLSAAKCGNGASGISFTTWFMFLASHLTTVVYAIVCLGDLAMALVFFTNGLACLAILAITLIKRRRHARRRVSDGPGWGIFESRFGVGGRASR